MITYKKGDKVRIINPEHPNYDCVTTVITPNNDERSWVHVEGGLRDDSDNAPEWNEVELYVEPTVEVKKQSIIRVQGGKTYVQYITNTHNDYVVFSGVKGRGHIAYKDIDHVIASLKRLKLEVASL